jgi:hypothetical protein
MHLEDRIGVKLLTVLLAVSLSKKEHKGPLIKYCAHMHTRNMVTSKTAMEDELRGENDES